MDLSTAQAHLAAWLAADLAVSRGQSYSVAGQSLTRADADTIQERITYWNRTVDALSAANADPSLKNPGIRTAKWS